ncbi:MAG: HAD-IIIA family hydrolase [Acidobacteria bacterium]|jgi:3-deoxy-D-manno-octulosonate 8-phosphate phosphatase (KDO 8-P phosphatase)|nr:HAD-IIIA family hydrolase [Acidobacteriota bacterium]
MAEDNRAGASDSLAAKIRPIKLLLFDVDGVLTDGSIFLDESGRETKRFDVKDGAGIKMAQWCGLEVAILSGRESGVTARRAEELGIKRIVQGALDKGPALEGVLQEAGVAGEETAYMGDDLLDLPCFGRVGVTACPSDAHPMLQREADYVCQRPGGLGAAREWIEVVLKIQGKFDGLVSKFKEGITNA